MDTIRIGRISSLNYAAGTARIVYSDRDDSVTAELPLLASEYFMPQVDDVVLVLHLPNGPEAGVVLGQFWSESHKPPESGAGIYRKDLNHSGTACIKYDDKTGVITLHSPGGVNVDGPMTATGDVTAAGTSVATHTHTSPATGGTTSKPN